MPEEGTVVLTASAITMGDLINLFQGQVGRMVVDKTDFKQLFDVPRMTINVGRFEISGPSVWPEITSGVLDQLGMKLEPVRAPVEVLVIDRVEKPTEN
jgi:uncharacterized protein (TIGR03435 family)